MLLRNAKAHGTQSSAHVQQKAQWIKIILRCRKPSLPVADLRNVGARSQSCSLPRVLLDLSGIPWGPLGQEWAAWDTGRMHCFGLLSLWGSP